MMGGLWLGLQLPIVYEHRDLDPDKTALSGESLSTQGGMGLLVYGANSDSR